MKTVLLLLAVVDAALSACDDGKNNVVDADDVTPVNNLAVSVNNVQVQTYDSSAKPACKNNAADVLLPGQLRAVKGEFDFAQHLQAK